MFDVYKIRKDFPMLDGTKTMQGKPLIFLDNASTTFKPQCVIDEMNKYYTTMTSNSHRGDYDLLYNMDKQVEIVRKKISSFINSEENEVIFTSGDTMALNLVAWGYGFKFLNKGDEIILSEAEHASNLLPWFKICELKGCVVKYVTIDENGSITPENLEKAISKNTKIVSIAHIGNVLGVTQDVKALAKVAHKYGALMVVDGAQSVPHLKTDFKDLDIDFLTFSGHKMCGPTGIGVLVGKYELLDKMDPFLTGGGMNEKICACGRFTSAPVPRKFEAGTNNLSGIMGLGAAVDYITSIGISEIRQHEEELHRYLMEKIKGVDKIICYNPNSGGSVFTFNIKGVFSQDEATLLNYKGIAVRSGEHCAKILHDYLKTNSTVRMSTYFYTTKEEIDAFVDALINGGDILDAYFN